MCSSDLDRAIDIVGDDSRGKFLRDGVAADVVAMKRDVDGAEAGREAGFFQRRRQALGEDDAAIGDAEQQEAFALPVALRDAGSHARDRLGDRFGVVLRGWGHEPKVLRAGAGLVQRKGEKNSYTAAIQSAAS